MALKYHDGRSTVDIDICLREQNHLYECCQKVAQQYGLPEDWINADVMHSDSFSYGLFKNASLFKTYENILKVYIVDELDLYCMKLISFRPKDVYDLEVLADSLKEHNVFLKDIEHNFNRLYGSLYLMKNDERKMRLIQRQFS